MPRRSAQQRMTLSDLEWPFTDMRNRRLLLRLHTEDSDDFLIRINAMQRYDY